MTGNRQHPTTTPPPWLRTVELACQLAEGLDESERRATTRAWGVVPEAARVVADRISETSGSQREAHAIDGRYYAAVVFPRGQCEEDSDRALIAAGYQRYGERCDDDGGGEMYLWTEPG